MGYEHILHGQTHPLGERRFLFPRSGSSMPPGRPGKSIANVTTFGPRDPRYPHCRLGDPGPGTPSLPSAPFLCSRRAPLPGFAPSECRPRPWALNCFRASNFLSCAFITRSACALSFSFVKSCPKTRNPRREHWSPNVQNNRRPAILPRLRVNFPPHFGMPLSGSPRHYFLIRNKGQVKNPRAVFLTQPLGGNSRFRHPPRGCPPAFPTHGLRGVHAITSIWHALRARSFHRGQLRLQGLLRLLPAVSSLGTPFMKLAPRQLLILSPIDCWSLRRLAVSVKRGLRCGM